MYHSCFCYTSHLLLYPNCHQLVNVKNTGHQKTDVHQQWNPACGNTGSSCVCGHHQQHHQWWTCIAHIYTAIRTMPASMKKPPVGGALSSSMHDAWAINSLNENNLNRLYPANNLSKTQNMFWEQQCLMIQNSFWIQNDLLPNIFVAKQLFIFFNTCAAYCSTFTTCIQL